jgi:hypothetical protein
MIRRITVLGRRGAAGDRRAEDLGLSHKKEGEGV